MPLVIASLLFAFNLIVELSFTNDLRGIPTFYNTQSTTNAAISISMGLSGAFDILCLSAIGLTVLIYSLVVRKRFSNKRFWWIVGISVAQLLLVQGTVAPVLARGLGPSAVGQNLRLQMDQSAETMDWIQSKPLPEGFSASDENSVQEEINVRWLSQSKAFDAANFDKVCDGVIAYAIDLGATDWIEKTGKTKGKGYAGVMKRHGFHGVSASHGAHKNHRKPGSIGACATPGRVFKGVRMSGRMGGITQTTQNLKVHAVDTEKGLILVKGAIPGPTGSVVLLRSAAKGA